MAGNEPNPYDLEVHIAEIYDQVEQEVEDLALLQSLIVRRRGLRILEPFCGSGRLLIPLAQAGHHLTGLDRAGGMLARARSKIDRLPEAVGSRIQLVQADVTRQRWPIGFDLVLLGGNCLYELATAAEQERCIREAAGALKKGGRLYVDNDRMEGALDPSWQVPGVRPVFPSGRCEDGTLVETPRELAWYDAAERLVRFRRRVRVARPDGEVLEAHYEQQKHPVSAAEVASWLADHGFSVLRRSGDHQGGRLDAGWRRAIFWAIKGVKGQETACFA